MKQRTDCQHCGKAFMAEWGHYFTDHTRTNTHMVQQDFFCSPKCGQDGAVQKLFEDCRVPAMYRFPFDRARHRTLELHDYVMQAVENLPVIDDTTRPGIYIHGRTGAGKTFSCVTAVLDMIQFDPELTAAITFSDTLAVDIVERTRPRQKGEDKPDSSLHELLAPLRHADVVLFDDLDSFSFTPRASAELWSLMRQRFDNRLTTFITANCPPAALAAKLPVETKADPFLRRIIEGCEVIDFDAGLRRAKA